eukprot:Rhum_TRINITY_DN15139_c4_g2::Rhum_TRINITY_DN15139_c4_g2_i7::g.140105::m.140105
MDSMLTDCVLHRAAADRSLALSLAETYHDTGVADLRDGKCKEALAWLSKACEIREEKAPNSLDLATTYHNIGDVCMEQGKNEALTWLNKARVIREEKAPNSLALAATCNNIGSSCNEQGKYDEA